MSTKVKVAQIYLSHEFFSDSDHEVQQESKDFFRAFLARRTVRGRLNPRGKDILSKIEQELEKITGQKVAIKWNNFCGCGMCPCSPGFDAHILREDVWSWRFRKRDARDTVQIVVRASKDGKIKIDRPASGPYQK